MNLQEQIAEFEAKGCVAGDRKWDYSEWRFGTTFSTIICGGLYPVNYNPILSQWRVRFNYEEILLNSTTLESALIEALDIVKAKVIDLAKELGFVCFDREQIKLIVKSLEIANAETHEPNWIKFQQLQQYIEEQCNEI